MKKAKKVIGIVVGVLVLLVLVAVIAFVFFSKKMEQQVSGMDLTAFQAVDLEGNTVTQDIFGDYEVTMINVWATWCEPCRKEMPDIQAAFEQLPENANIISVCTDAGENEALAGQIVETTGAKYMVLVPDSDTAKQFSSIHAYPTTLFVDSKGQQIGSPITGAPSGTDLTQFYLSRINELLEQ